MILNAYISKEKLSKTNTLTFHFKKLEKGEQVKSKVSARK